ncbi:MAG TPA: hypothetical protein VJB06_01100, partial [archaeon]|nr:hypothetical protein [archaeon]
MEKNYLLESKKLFDYLLSIKKEDFWKELIDLETNINYGQTMIDDLGDTMPFMAWFGKGHKKYLEEADRISRLSINKFGKNGLYKTTNSSALSKFSFFDSNKMSDLILGINLLYQITKNKFYLEASKNFFNSLESLLTSKEGFVNLIYLNGIKLKFTSGSFSGLYIEELCNLYSFSKDERYLRQAQRIADYWLNTDSFKKSN